MVQEEVTVCSDDKKRKDVQHRNRTTFTPEQSKALEQGDLNVLKVYPSVK